MMWERPAVRKKLKLTVKCSKSIALTHCPPRSPLGFFHPGFKFTVLGSPNQGVLSKCLRRWDLVSVHSPWAPVSRGRPH